MGEPDNDDAQYAALAEEMRQVDIEEGLPPQDYGQPLETVQRPHLDEQRHDQGWLPEERERLPDVMEDPVSNLDQRMSAMEAQNGISRLRERGSAAEVSGRAKYGKDFDGHISHLREVVAAEQERRQGRRMTEAEREQGFAHAAAAAMVEADRLGMPLEDFIRGVSVETGYVPEQAFGKHEYVHLNDALAKARDGDAFDRIWAAYERAERRSERRHG